MSRSDSRLDYDRVASVLVEAAFFGDSQAANRWGITERTVRRYRSKMGDDDELSSIVQVKKENFEQNWAEEIPAAIRSATRFLMTASVEADPKDPQAIHAVAGAMKIMAEVGLTKEILDVRLGRYDRPGGKENRPLDSIPASTD